MPTNLHIHVHHREQVEQYQQFPHVPNVTSNNSQNPPSSIHSSNDQIQHISVQICTHNQHINQKSNIPAQHNNQLQHMNLRHVPAHIIQDQHISSKLINSPHFDIQNQHLSSKHINSVHFDPQPNISTLPSIKNQHTNPKPNQQKVHQHISSKPINSPHLDTQSQHTNPKPNITTLPSIQNQHISSKPNTQTQHTNLKSNISTSSKVNESTKNLSSAKSKKSNTIFDDFNSLPEIIHEHIRHLSPPFLSRIILPSPVDRKLSHDINTTVQYSPAFERSHSVSMISSVSQKSKSKSKSSKVSEYPNDLQLVNPTALTIQTPKIKELTTQTTNNELITKISDKKIWRSQSLELLNAEFKDFKIQKINNVNIRSSVMVVERISYKDEMKDIKASNRQKPKQFGPNHNPRLLVDRFLLA